jgi:fructose-1,6-bisphosphatase I
MYECMALAFIAEEAGGAATDGKNRIMDIVPNHIHQQVPYFVGSREMVEKAASFHS